MLKKTTKTHKKIQDNEEDTKENINELDNQKRHQRDASFFESQHKIIIANQIILLYNFTQIKMF